MRAEAARSLVKQFVDAEMDGDSETAWALLTGCDVLPTADYIEPTLSYEILDAIEQNGRVTIPVRYVVLGKAWSYDVRQVGQHNWRFVPDVRVDTVEFSIDDDREGPLRIVCAYLPPIHDAAMQMAGTIERFDEESRAAWEDAMRKARELR